MQKVPNHEDVVTKRMARNIFIFVTKQLVNKNDILDERSGDKFLQAFFSYEQTDLQTKSPTNNQGNVFNSNQTAHSSNEVILGTDTLSNSPNEISLDSPELCTTSEANESLNFASIEQMEVWNQIIRQYNFFGPSKMFPAIKMQDLRPTSTRQLQQNDAISILKGDIYSSLEGYQMYKRYGKDYTGTIIFNLGVEWSYEWFCTKNYLSLPQSQILQNGDCKNCQIVILKCYEKPEPLIFATSSIKENEVLCLSTKNLQKLNSMFLLWKSNADSGKRSSQRVTNLNLHLEQVYVHHLLANTECGIEKRQVETENRFGVFATKFFHRKDFIVEYKGKLLTHQEGSARFKKMGAKYASYFFGLGKAFSNQWMDATDAKDCIGRYLQHSSKDFNCKPICRIVGEKPRVFFVAGEDIDSGSELRYNHCNRMLETATP